MTTANVANVTADKAATATPYKATLVLLEGVKKVSGADFYDFFNEITNGISVPVCTGPLSNNTTVLIDLRRLFIHTNLYNSLAAVKLFGKEALQQLSLLQRDKIADFSTEEAVEQLYGIDLSWTSNFKIRQLPEQTRRLIARDGVLGKFEIEEHLREYPWLGSFPDQEQVFGRQDAALLQPGYQRFWFVEYVTASSGEPPKLAEFRDTLEQVVARQEVAHRTNLLQILQGQTRNPHLQQLVKESLERLSK